MNMAHSFQASKTVIGRAKVEYRCVTFKRLTWLRHSCYTRQSPADATPGEVKQKPHHVLLVADPQIVDKYSYPGRGIILSYFTRLIVDLNLRKNWQAALRKRPDTVVFLGDMMDNGRLNMALEEYVDWHAGVVYQFTSFASSYESLYLRFRSIFNRQGQTFDEYFIPGNHDTG